MTTRRKNPLPSSINIDEGAEAEFSGQVIYAGGIAAMRNAGTLIPVGFGDDGGDIGSITIAGNYFQEQTGTLKIDLANTTNDKLIVTGATNRVSLAGTLDVTLAEGFAVLPGGVFTIISNQSLTLVSGYFTGHPDNSTFTVGTTKFRINYGLPSDNNDVTLTIVNDPPVAHDDTATTNEDVPCDIDVLANDTDPNNDTLSIASVGLAAGGSVEIVGSVIHYTPNPNFNGSDSFVYTVSDGHGSTDTAIVFITVTPVNDNPTAVDDSATVTLNFTSSIIVLTNDSDIDGDAIVLSGIPVGPQHGTASISGSFVQYTPNNNFSGTDTLTYQISDGHGGTATAVVTITVTQGGGGPGGSGGGDPGGPGTGNPGGPWTGHIKGQVFRPC